MKRTAIILAGGFGTRLQSVISEVPKPMAPINGVPFLNYQLNYLKYFGITQVIMSVGYLAEKIKAYYKNSFNGILIDYAYEETPMGTGGGIRLALQKTESKEVLVLNGDSFFEVDLKEFYRQHHAHQLNFSIATRRIENAGRYGTIELERNTQESENFFKIKTFKEKSNLETEGVINGGVYILNNEQFCILTNPLQNFSIEKDFFEIQSAKQNIGAFLSNGYFIDIGVPQDYTKAQHDFKEFRYK
jgi:D-glycero-alpha-D-manno-heptose 1-phosphate guanylyltransferase